MIATSLFQSIKLDIIATVGLSKDALHIYVGLAVFLVAVALFRKPLKSISPWIVVFTVAIAGEVLDRRDDIASLGHWRWAASLHDIINTLFWPTVLIVLARFSSILGGSSDQNT
ncbi:hypothetical protein LG201_10115 [Methylobacillus gramineus]|uniref:hypothetical protein n=1 Tax=Methylobacillus gramineus TaxID=755169 RepID=UPI001CFF5BE2|nr:hypothetical protein [Methylobacillus gramineus]MCB5185556.1 hypothetical protein [Methylobacillus gramineus]